MKFVILLCVLGALLLECHSSPVQLVENHELVARSKAMTNGRQSNNDIAPAAVSNNDEDDDDDDDDDDDPDLGDLVDDDDDDDDDDEDDTPQGQAAPAADDDEEDDEEEDYLDRIFDDILDDDEDDDDDDDEDSSSSNVQQAAQQQQPAASSVAQPASPVNGAIDVASIADGVEPVPSGQSADYPAEGEQNVFYDEENGGIDTKVDVQSLNNQPAVPSTTTKITVAQNDAAAAAADDDDDDDDEDDITGALSDDDDDDDDDADDDDDDDDIVGDDVIEARRARAFKNNEATPPSGKDAFQERHNRFIDAIFDRINNIVSSSYDPFKVRLNGNSKQAKATTANGKKRKQHQQQQKKLDKKGRTLLVIDENAIENKKKRRTIDSNEMIPKVQSIESINSFSKKSVDDDIINDVGNNDEKTTNIAAENRTTKTSNKVTPKKAYNNLPSGTTGKPSSGTSAANGGSTTGNTGINKQKLKQNVVEEKLRKAEGTLYGLASLKRVGNVKVLTDPEGKNSTIKSKFTLGPLTLKVEKSFKRGNVRSVKSATAKTNEMIGRIKFRVVNDSATLMSIKVQQPKQVEVESKDNHDRTREFVWKRTPHIAHLVSEKLKLAAESLFEPTGSEVVRL